MVTDDLATLGEAECRRLSLDAKLDADWGDSAGRRFTMLRASVPSTSVVQDGGHTKTELVEPHDRRGPSACQLRWGGALFVSRTERPSVVSASVSDPMMV